jgi:hypothetical protein
VSVRISFDVDGHIENGAHLITPPLSFTNLLLGGDTLDKLATKSD